MKKLLLAFIFFLTFFAVKSFATSPALAANAHITGWLHNDAGKIDVKVTVWFYSSASPSEYRGSSIDYTIPKGQSAWLDWTDPLGDVGGYRSTLVLSPQGVLGLGIIDSNGMGDYTLRDFDVHNYDTNSTDTITYTSCLAGNTGHVEWKVNVYGDGNGINEPNIGHFKVYKSQGNADNGTYDTVDYDYATHTNYAYSTDLTPVGLASGTWNIAVKAFPQSPDDQVGYAYAVYGSFSCGSSVLLPSNPVANVTCASTAIRVDFSWNAATPGTYNYLVETIASPTDPGTGGSWTLSATPNPTTAVYASNQTGWTAATSYWVRVKATLTVSPFTVYYSSPSIMFTTPSSCATGHLVYPPMIVNIFNCYDLASTPDPNKVRVDVSPPNGSWTTPVYTVVPGQQFVDYGTDAAFGNFKSVVDSSTATINDPVMFPVTRTLYFRTRALMTDGKWYVSQVAAVGMDPTKCTGAGTNPTLLAYADCGYFINGIGSAPTYYPQVHLHWTGINGDDADKTFYVLRNGVPPDTLSTSSANYNWTSGPKSTIYWQEQSNQTNNWTVRGQFGVFVRTSPAVPVTNPDCSASGIAGPAQVHSPMASAVCGAGGKVMANFTWSGTATGGSYSLEVSTQPFTGPYTSYPNNKWAAKIIPYVGNAVYVWSIDTPFDGGDANPTYPAKNLVPLDGRTYYWRVKLVNAGGAGTYVYSDPASAGGGYYGTLYPNGLPVVAPVCKHLYDLSATIDTNSWRNVDTGKEGNNFKANDNVRVDVIVTNVSGQYISTLAQSVGNSSNLLWFYYDSVGSSPPGPPVACTATAPGGGGQALSLGLPSGGLTAGGTVNVTVYFTPASGGSFTAYADVAPACTFSGETPAGFENDPTNNVSDGAGYIVDVPKFFETKGGDVGAKGNISIGVPSPPDPYNISDYLIVGNDATFNTISLLKQPVTGTKLSSYGKSLALSGGVYNYFASRFRSKAQVMPTACTVKSTDSYNTGNKLYYCDDNLTIASGSAPTISGNPVFFIDGNLTINDNVSLGANSTTVFIVKGNINVATTVTSMNGIYIARKGFADSDNGGEIPAASGSGGKLTINGALYVDREESASLDLSRHWGGSYVGTNATAPSNAFIFNPAYIPILNSILATSPVGWQETAP